jgi:hypothetical protein
MGLRQMNQSDAIDRRAALALVSMLAFARAGFAEAGIVGTVSKLIGTPSIRRAGGRRVAAARGMMLRLGDKVATGLGGRLEVQATDGTTIIIGENTTVVLARFAAPHGVRPGWGLLDLIEGILRIQLPGPWNRFEVTTATAVASVRSTDWLIDATSDNTAVFVATGRVEVVNRAVTGAVLLDAGFGTDVKAGALPTVPKRWGQTRVDAAMARTRIP